MSKYVYRSLGMLALACVVALGMIASQGTNVVAQVKAEICDNKVDDDDDKLIDCEDSDCKCEPEPPKGPPCSPGYWKNHADEFNATCVQVSGWTCQELYTAITCRGSNASCRRQAAAAALNAVSGCTE